METFLQFSNFNSLLNYLNVVLIGAVVFYTTNKYNYIIDVIAYALAKTIIPMITYLIFGSLIGAKLQVSVGTVFILFLVYFIIGLLIIRIMEKIVDAFNSDTIVNFIFIFGIIDTVVFWLISLLINIFIH